MTKYFSSNPSLSNQDAKKIGVFIDKHFKGSVTAKELLNIARDEKSFLHKFFDWDDSSAAEKYRLSQARNLIVSIHVEADDLKPIRHYMRVNIGSGSTYMRQDEIAKSQDLVDQVIVVAHNQLVQWKDRYGRYCEYFNFNFQIKEQKYEIKGNPRKESDNSRSKQENNKRDHRRNNSASGKQI